MSNLFRNLSGKNDVGFIYSGLFTMSLQFKELSNAVAKSSESLTV